jgi:SAM-dependent methyltransferase
LGIGPHRDEPGLAQHPQVLGDQRLAHAEDVDELAHRLLTAPEQIEDVPAGRLGDHGEDHREIMPERIYNCQGIVCPIGGSGLAGEMAGRTTGRWVEDGVVRSTDETAAESYGERWADIYDDVHALAVPDAQLDLLAVLAGQGRAVELGVGTGRVALPLAARGVRVEGVDASPAMVARLGAKPGGDRLPVTLGDMAELAVAGTFTLAYVLFNTFFILPDQAAQVRCFRRVAQVLEPGGAFVLECFVPDPARFDRHGQSLRTVRVDPDGVMLDASVHDPVTQTVRARHITLGDGSVRVRPIRLRYAWPAELDLMAQLAGLRLRSRWASWGGEPFTASSTGHVSVYERPA